MKTLAAIMAGGLFSLCYTVSSRSLVFWVAIVTCAALVAYVRN